MSARLPDITSDPCVAERHNATRVYRTITMIRMTIPCKTDWVCGLAEPTDFELPRPAQVGRKVRRQRLHLPRTAATIRVSSSTPFCERTSSAPTISSPTCLGSHAHVHAGGAEPDAQRAVGFSGSNAMPFL